jgi:hypothetical protein
MALTKEVIISNPALKDLTDAQIADLVTLSVNDENTVIGKRIGELHGEYEKDIVTVTGIQKPSGVKTYEFMKTVLTDLKNGTAELPTVKQQLQTLQAEKKQLEDDIKAGKGNEIIAKQLQDAKDNIAQLKGAKDKEVLELKTQLTEALTRNQSIQMDMEFNRGTADLKFKPEFPKNIISTLINNAKAKILATYKPDYIDDGNGGKVLVFRDDKDVIIRNNSNQLNPYTAGELIAKELAEILDTKKVEGGGGSGGPGGNGKPAETLDLSQAKNQVDADKLITAHIAALGIARGTKEFSDKQTQLRKDNKVADLPMR